MKPIKIQWTRKRKYQALFLSLLVYLFAISTIDLYWGLPFSNLLMKFGYFAILCLSIVEMTEDYQRKHADEPSDNKGSRRKRFNVVYLLILVYLFVLSLINLFSDLPILVLLKKPGYFAILCLVIVDLTYLYHDKAM